MTPLGAAYRHYSLRCPVAHTIPLPHPIQVDVNGSLRKIDQDNRKAIFVCPVCGHVSAYCGRDIRETIAGTPSPFEAGECDLFVVEIECDGENCEAHKLVHTAYGVSPRELGDRQSLPKTGILANRRFAGPGTSYALI
jgi:hypothetical protein